MHRDAHVVITYNNIRLARPRRNTLLYLVDTFLLIFRATAFSFYLSDMLECWRDRSELFIYEINRVIDFAYCQRARRLSPSPGFTKVANTKKLPAPCAPRLGRAADGLILS